MSDALPEVLSAYGIKPEQVRPAGGTAGRTWRVSSGGSDYFVRRRGSRTSSRWRIEFDHGLRHHLAGHGFCAVPPLQADSGEGFVEGRDGVYEVYPWVAGEPWPTGAAGAARASAAAELARLHQFADSYAAPCEPRVPQFSHLPGQIMPSARFDDPRAVGDTIDFVLKAWSTPSERAELGRARERVSWLAGTYATAVYETLPRGVIHGDYNAANLLFRPSGKVVGVFDYDWAWHEVRVRDLADGILFFAARRQGVLDGGDIWSLTACPELDIDQIVGFLCCYSRQRPLTNAECDCIGLAVLARWAACRTEGVMKVPEPRRAEFVRAGFLRPFEWYDRHGSTLREALRAVSRKSASECIR